MENTNEQMHSNEDNNEQMHKDYKKQAKEAYDTCQGLDQGTSTVAPLETVAPEKPLEKMEPCDIKQKKQNWYFTFGCGHEHEGTCIQIHGTFESAREKMFNMYGNKWAFQYSQNDYNLLLKRGYWYPVKKYSPDEE